MMKPLLFELNWRFRCHGSEKLGSVCTQKTFTTASMKGASFTSSLPTPPSSYIWACPLGDSKGVGNNEGIACSGHATIASVKPLIPSDPDFFLTPPYGNTSNTDVQIQTTNH
jgi:hypothetical protein